MGDITRQTEQLFQEKFSDFPIRSPDTARKSREYGQKGLPKNMGKGKFPNGFSFLKINFIFMFKMA